MYCFDIVLVAILFVYCYSCAYYIMKLLYYQFVWQHVSTFNVCVSGFRGKFQDFQEPPQDPDKSTCNI